MRMQGFMPRKIRKKDTQKWWDERLKRLGLGVSAGRNRKLSYVGTSNDLEIMAQYQKRDSKVRPEGHGHMPGDGHTKDQA